MTAPFTPVGRILCVALLAMLFRVDISAQNLIAAVRDGRLDQVRALLKSRVDVNGTTGDGMSALHWAAQLRRVDIAAALIEAGADVGASTRIGGYTPLLMASRLGVPAMVTLLLDHRADPNRANANGTTPLMFAAAAGDATSVAALIRAGADVNARENGRGQSALMFAAAYGRAEVVRVLTEHGAEVDAVSQPIPVGPVLATELERRRKEAAWAKASTAPLRQSGSRWGSTELETVEISASDGYVDPVPGVERDYTFTELVGGWGGLGAIHLAARRGAIPVVEALLAAGATIDLRTAGNQSTALLLATINGHFDTARVLLERGADPSARQDNGLTPLFAALDVQWASKAFYPQPRAHEQQHTSYLELITLLLDKGAEVNARTHRKVWTSGYATDRSEADNAGATAFWRAAYGADVEAMKILVARGADPGIPTIRPHGNMNGGGGSGYARLRDISGLPPVPIGGPGVPALLAASGLGYASGYAGNAHRFAPTGMLKAVKYLIEELHLDVNVRDFEGNTAMHNAAARGDNEMILYLISRGADPHAVNRFGQTTVDMANGPVQRSPPYPETIKLLEAMGVKNNHRCLSC